MSILSVFVLFVLLWYLNYIIFCHPSLENVSFIFSRLDDNGASSVHPELEAFCAFLSAIQFICFYKSPSVVLFNLVSVHLSSGVLSHASS